jgi:hypothetical protein
MVIITKRRISMKPETRNTIRELSSTEVAFVSGGEVTQQGGGLPKPIIGKKPPEGPLPIFTDLP